MGFKPIRLGQEPIFTLVVQDETGRTDQKWVSMKSDFIKTLRNVNEKYGLGIWDKRREEQKEKNDKDLEWLGIGG